MARQAEEVTGAAVTTQERMPLAPSHQGGQEAEGTAPRTGSGGRYKGQLEVSCLLQNHGAHWLGHNSGNRRMVIKSSQTSCTAGLREVSRIF